MQRRRVAIEYFLSVIVPKRSGWGGGEAGAELLFKAPAEELA